MNTVAHDLRTWRFWRSFLIEAFSAVGILAVLLEVTNFILGRSVAQGWPLALVVTLVSMAYGTIRAWPRPIRQDYNSPNTTVEIVKGDLFAQQCNLVIGTCDTFDTSVPNIIALTSVQGQALSRLYGGDVERLNGELDTALAGKDQESEISKPGKTAKYGIGTVATLRNGPRQIYFLAYSEMNRHNEAQSTPDGIWRSLESLWAEVSRTSNGTPVAIPVIGGGQSRLSQLMPAQDSIRFTIMSFMFASRTRRVCDKLTIVVRPADFDRLDRLELQAFLRSLRPS
ncbi:macro domain-containing protein [Luteimicrobium sp. DT211]|uniref:macro domain-containing protein n=1 Tax=Luteimicrobium sp. DT211 TaxID=3393412 RepID=UPI003CF995CA